MWTFLKLLQKRIVEQDLDKETRENNSQTQDAKRVSEKQSTSAPLSVILHGLPAWTQLFLNALIQEKVLQTVARGSVGAIHLGASPSKT